MRDRDDSARRAVAVFDAIREGALAVVAITSGDAPPQHEVDRAAGLVAWAHAQLKPGDPSAETVRRIADVLKEWCHGSVVPDHVARLAAEIVRRSRERE